MSEVLEHIDNQKFTPANNVMRVVETCHDASLQVIYFCDSPQDGTANAADGLSVRCVKDE